MKIKQKQLVSITLTTEEVNLLIKTLEPISESSGRIEALLTELKLQTVWRNEKFLD